MLREDRGHLLAVLQTLARHWHQKLQGRLRQDLVDQGSKGSRSE
jgi:hypothetical protein